MGFRVGDVTVASASDDDLHLVAAVTGLSERMVRRRCDGIHGKTLLRNAFRDDWPYDAEGLEGCTAALARAAGLELEIANATGLSERTVSHRLSSVAGKMYVGNAFPELVVSDDAEADEEEEEEEGEATLSGATATPADLLGAVPIVCIRALPHVVAWLAERLETSPRRLRRQLRDDHGRRLLRNFLGDRWPLDVDETAERLLEDLPVAVLRRAPSLVEWIARVAHIRPDEVLGKLRQARDDALAGELFPALDARGKSRQLHPASVPPEDGRIVAGRWRLVRKLGEGTFGAVYEVKDVEHDIGKFVLKVARGTANAKLLEDEIGLACKLRHDNICGYHLIGHDPSVGTYLVLDYGGESLEKRIGSDGAFDVRDALEIAGCVAAALDYAHRKGVIHQDVKPSNILIEGQGTSREVRLTDFGISRLGRGTERARGGRTISATVMGFTPAYAAPEQWLGREARRASDQYSLALVFCSMLEGEVFASRYTPRRFARVNANQNAAVARALHEDADRRFESCMAFVRELEAV